MLNFPWLFGPVLSPSDSSGSSPAVAVEGEAPPAEDSVSSPVENTGDASLAGGGVPPSEPEPSAGGAASPKDWRDNRIARLTAKLQQKEREAQEAREQAEALRTSQANPSGLLESEVERRAALRAAEIAAANEFNEKCNRTAQDGQKVFGKEVFLSRVSNLTQLVDRSDQESLAAYNAFLDAAIETGEGPKLIHDLGADLNEAARIMALPPTKMAIALAKLAIKPAVSDVSRAPKPLDPVRPGGRANENLDPNNPEVADRLSTAEWMRRREARLKSAS